MTLGTDEPSTSSHKTVLGFNPSQVHHVNTINKDHPENPGRIERVRQICEETKLLLKCTVLEKFPSVDELDLQASQDAEYVRSMLSQEGVTDQQALNQFASTFDSVFLSTGSVVAAKEAVACCRTIAEMIMCEEAPNGIAVVRPPGHHADTKSACGFSIFNNAAQAAEAAYNFEADRILIVDFDVHHGQGIQRKFYDEKRVLYVSIHRYERGKFWPHLEESNYNFIGEGEGRGYNINIPLNDVGCGDSDYLSAFWNVLWPVAVEFDPHMVIVAAGFDSCEGDPLGEMKLTPDCYSHMIYQLKALAKGKLLVVLEGGYNHEVTAVGLQRCLRILTGSYPFALEKLAAPKESTVSSCLNAISLLRNFWTCFDFYNVRVGTRSLPWDVHSSDASFCPQLDEKRENTGNILQSELPTKKYELPVEGGTSATLLVYDATDDRHFDCEDTDHPENPERTKRIMGRLEDSGLKSKCVVVENSRLATEEQLETAHERPYVQMIKRTSTMSQEKLTEMSEKMDSIFLTKHTFEVAQRAVGSVLECVDRVCEAPVGSLNAFAIVRPPGHHAGISKPSGFCIFNNVAVAAKYAISKFGVKRVLIVDWDVHHGNGTQEIFYEDSNVLYMSVHRHDEGMFYPMGEAKDTTDVGEREGEGFSVNVPFSGGRMGDAEYRAAFTKIILPIAYEFNPDLVFISAGFDAAKGDPLGAYKVLPETFALLTHQLCGLAAGRTIAVLEGGYNLESISLSAEAVLETMLNRGLKRRYQDAKEQYCTVKPRLHPDAWVSLRRAAQTQAKYWNCLKGYQVDCDLEYAPVVYSRSSSESGGEGTMADLPSSSSGPADRTAAGLDAGELEVAGLDVGARHAVVPLATCPHLVEVVALPAAGIDSKDTCVSCGIAAEPWVCLGCYQAHCGRHVYEHALMHHLETSHPMALSLADLSVWCYPCDSYVHNQILIPAKNSAHLSKFGETMPN